MALEGGLWPHRYQLPSSATVCPHNLTCVTHRHHSAGLSPLTCFLWCSCSPLPLPLPYFLARSLALRHASPHLSIRGPVGAISGWVCGGKERGLVIMESHYWLVQLSLLTYLTVCRLPSLHEKITLSVNISHKDSFHLTLRVRRSSNRKDSRDSSNPSFQFAYFWLFALFRVAV